MRVFRETVVVLCWHVPSWFRPGLSVYLSGLIMLGGVAPRALTHARSNTRTHAGGATLSSRGELFLTTQRMIFVPKKQNTVPLDIELSC